MSIAGRTSDRPFGGSGVAFGAASLHGLSDARRPSRALPGRGQRWTSPARCIRQVLVFQRRRWRGRGTLRGRKRRDRETTEGDVIPVGRVRRPRRGRDPASDTKVRGNGNAVVILERIIAGAARLRQYNEGAGARIRIGGELRAHAGRAGRDTPGVRGDRRGRGVGGGDHGRIGPVLRRRRRGRREGDRAVFANGRRGGGRTPTRIGAGESVVVNGRW
mmetsp:Transcript_34712/g.73942  ORF Transcript_34712/g.73942 Transcript_34712/m.73942 type:complete len:218 (+) Transcript_34712:86-739(+)